MNPNEGTTDRALRIAGGLVLLALSFVGPAKWLALVAIVLLATGIVGYCPVYHFFGIRTRRGAS